VHLTPKRSGYALGSTPGLAQVLGSPLHDGDAFAISGAVQTGTTMLVRSAVGVREFNSSFSLSGSVHSTLAVVHVDDSKSGLPRIWLTIGRRVVRPTITT
jgi:hypothetical protein